MSLSLNRRKLANLTLIGHMQSYLILILLKSLISIKTDSLYPRIVLKPCSSIPSEIRSPLFAYFPTIATFPLVRNPFSPSVGLWTPLPNNFWVITRIEIISIEIEIRYLGYS